LLSHQIKATQAAATPLLHLPRQVVAVVPVRSVKTHQATTQATAVQAHHHP
jgi:glucose/arabinose dehydrogenase